MIRKGTLELTSLDDWLEHAGPKRRVQWQDHRSAKESARAWLDSPRGAIPTEIAHALQTHADFGEILSWEAEPECRVRFDSFRSEPANLDMLLRATDVHGLFVVAVEAKADEPFGAALSEQLKAARRREEEHPRSEGVKRLEQLAQALFATSPSDLHSVELLRYQLCTAAVAALAEAERQEATRAVVLIHEFVTRRTADDKHRTNGADLDAFVSRLSPTKSASVTPGTLSGPFLVPGKPLIHSERPLYIGKAVRDMRVPSA